MNGRPVHSTPPQSGSAFPQQRSKAPEPRGTEPANALSPLRARFVTAVVGIFLLGGLAVACAASLAVSDRGRAWPATILVISVLLLISAVIDAARLIRRVRREPRR